MMALMMTAVVMMMMIEGTPTKNRSSCLRETDREEEREE